MMRALAAALLVCSGCLPGLVVDDHPPPSRLTVVDGGEGSTLTLSWINPKVDSLVGIIIRKGAEAGVCPTSANDDSAPQVNANTDVVTAFVDTDTDDRDETCYGVFAVYADGAFSIGALAAGVSTDRTAPAQLAAFTAEPRPDATAVAIAWTDPDDDGERVVIRRREGTQAPQDDDDGTLVYDGTSQRDGETLSDGDVVIGVTYSYAAFVVDEAQNVSQPATAAVTVLDREAPPIANAVFVALSSPSGAVQLAWSPPDPTPDDFNGVIITRADNVDLDAPCDAGATVVFEGFGDDVESIPSPASPAHVVRYETVDPQPFDGVARYALRFVDEDNNISDAACADVDRSAFVAAPVFARTLSFGAGGNFDVRAAVAVDGAVFIAGSYRTNDSETDLVISPSVTFPARTEEGAFIMRIEADGTIAWASPSLQPTASRVSSMTVSEGLVVAAVEINPLGGPTPPVAFITFRNPDEPEAFRALRFTQDVGAGAVFAHVTSDGTGVVVDVGFSTLDRDSARENPCPDALEDSAVITAQWVDNGVPTTTPPDTFPGCTRVITRYDAVDVAVEQALTISGNSNVCGRAEPLGAVRNGSSTAVLFRNRGDGTSDAAGVTLNVIPALLLVNIANNTVLATLRVEPNVDVPAISASAATVARALFRNIANGDVLNDFPTEPGTEGFAAAYDGVNAPVITRVDDAELAALHDVTSSFGGLSFLAPSGSTLATGVASAFSFRRQAREIGAAAQPGEMVMFVADLTDDGGARFASVFGSTPATSGPELPVPLLAQEAPAGDMFVVVRGRTGMIVDGAPLDDGVAILVGQ
jgi:hypothetical protein